MYDNEHKSKSFLGAADRLDSKEAVDHLLASRMARLCARQYEYEHSTNLCPPIFDPAPLFGDAFLIGRICRRMAELIVRNEMRAHAFAGIERDPISTSGSPAFKPVVVSGSERDCIQMPAHKIYFNSETGTWGFLLASNLARIFSEITGDDDAHSAIKVSGPGVKRTVEGGWTEGREIVAVIDAVDYGDDFADAVQALRNEAGTVREALCIIDLEKGAFSKLRKIGVRLTSLFTLREIGEANLRLHKSKAQESMKKEEIDALEECMDFCPGSTEALSSDEIDALLAAVNDASERKHD